MNLTQVFSYKSAVCAVWKKNFLQTINKIVMLITHKLFYDSFTKSQQQLKP